MYYIIKIKKMYKYLLPIFLFVVISSISLSAQDNRLAQQYFNDGEFEKAATIFKQLYEKHNNNDYYFSQYLKCLTELEDFDNAENLIKKQIKKNNKNYRLYLEYGNLLSKQRKEDEALTQYNLAIDKINNDVSSIRYLAIQFQNKQQYDLALKAYEKGIKANGPEEFSYYMAELFRAKGNTEKMIENYLISLRHQPSRINSLKTIFERYFTEDDFLELQMQLYSAIQENPDEEVYNEMLTWVFIHKKDYKGAMRQAKALDARYEENGGRVYQIASIASNAKDYKVAIDGFEYIIENKGMNSGFYIDAKKESLKCKRLQLVDGYEYSQEELFALKKEYESFLDEFGRSKTTAEIILQQAELEALYINDLNKGISLLNELIEYPGVYPRTLANAKLSLADFYLMDGEIWESTLLYSQVDKQYKDDLLGQEARYRNALLSYFAGDFEWAQTQFNVLKASTSKLIANDALDRSIFIMDNLALDTTAVPLIHFSQAELLVFQNKFDEAFLKLDTIRNTFPNHSLEDDAFYLKANIYKKLRDYDKSAIMYQNIIDNFADGIRADNAIFELAELYETQLNNLDKAAELYERILYDYSGSTYSVEARKRYRRISEENL